MSTGFLFRRIVTCLTAASFIVVFSWLFAGCMTKQPAEGADAEDASATLVEGLDGGVHAQAVNADGSTGAVTPTPHPMSPVAAVNDGDAEAKAQRVYTTLGPGQQPPDPPLVLIANFGDNKVEVFNTFSGAFLPPISVGSKPRDLALTPDRQSLFVSNSASPSISIIDIGSLKLTGTIPLPVGSSPYGIAFTPEGATAYVANFGTPGGVFAIDVPTQTIKTTIPVGDSPIKVTISPDGMRVFVTNLDGNSLSIIDTLTNTVEKTVPLPSPVAVATSPNGRFIYVTTNVFADTGTLTVLNSLDYSVDKTLTVGNLPVALTICPTGRFLFVANAGSTFVSQVSTVDNSVMQNVPSAQGIQTVTCLQHH